jgi:hypothetical protein
LNHFIDLERILGIMEYDFRSAVSGKDQLPELNRSLQAGKDRERVVLGGSPPDSKQMKKKNQDRDKERD